MAVGMDLVHVPGLAHQLTIPGTVFAERAFTARELREAQRRADRTGALAAEPLAARWAAKESFIKAWSQALVVRARQDRGSGGSAPVIAPESVDWREIELVSDRWGRPSLNLTGAIADAVEFSLGAGVASAGHWPVSLTHDGDWAAAIVLWAGA
ncbi:Holo-[acyl-carrier-protein] synthase [Actinomyces denticolens]|nr:MULTISPECIES: holo-ACP synthase [Actinomyces]SUU04825.1 Holo-[acyl-carrier-protein] synthase [Actinomyces denticolens]